jgi:cell division protein FtsI (penicillin-binding protein 3)
VVAENTEPDAAAGRMTIKPSAALNGTVVVPAALRKTVTSTMAAKATDHIAEGPSGAKVLPTGTVVLDVEQGGIVVPSFVGKTVRTAIEAAQDNGLELDAIGSGIARDQSPPAGSHVAAGARIIVRFDR